jgi:threonine aldolase
MICLENTHNKAGGTIYPVEEIQKIHDLARNRKLTLHLDGARLWNASVATGIAPREYARFFDTVSVCFSKGLGAPIGSALTGTREKIDSARKYRKIFGGGMRQVGILAAGALFALDHNIGRLKKDHDNAKLLAKELSNLPGIHLDLNSVQTNIIIFEMSGRSESAEEIISKLKAKGVLISGMGISTLRAVTHLDVSREQIQRASETIKSLLGN